MIRCLLLVAALCLSSAARAAAPDGLMVDSIDHAVAPCDDFYHFACNGWLKANPIPPDQATWDVGSPLVERNNLILKEILEQAAAMPAPDTQRLGDYWAACTDHDAIEAKGLTPLQPELDAIAAIADTAGLAPALARLQRLGVDVLFEFSSDRDPGDATRIIAEADQGGLGLPDRSYYLKRDAAAAAIRTDYTAHLARMAALTGTEPAHAALDAKAVLHFETRLARAAQSENARIDPHATYHPVARAALDKLMPGFAWERYLEPVGAPPLDRINVEAPDYFSALAAIIAGTKLDTLKAYLRARLLEHVAEFLPERFGAESFRFYSTTLQGTQTQKPRWKRCIGFADEDLGEALGKLYVARTFGPAGKAAVAVLVANLKAAFAEDLAAVPWMAEETRRLARAKLSAMAEKIGYPDHWRDYGGLEIRRDDALGNRFRAAAFELDRDFAKIGKPIDRGEWAMTAPTVNAYYDDTKNDINFPAGTLQPPYFDPAWDDAVNYGSIGAVIGHEMTHGFDNAGRMYDAAGILRDWWSRRDARRFTSRAACLVRQYDGYSVADQVHLDGTLTLGENTADNGGTRLAFLALVKALAGRTPPPLDGFTAEQRFFVAYAQSYCQNQAPEAARLQALTDPHATAEFRVNGVVRNMPEFAHAFACPANAPMAPEKACRVW